MTISRFSLGVSGETTRARARARASVARGTTVGRESQRKQTPIFRYGTIKAVLLTQLDQLFRYKERARKRYRSLATACALDSGFLVTSVH